MVWFLIMFLIGESTLEFSENCGYGEEDLLEIRSLGIPSIGTTLPWK